MHVIARTRTTYFLDLSVVVYVHVTNCDTTVQLLRLAKVLPGRVPGTDPALSHTQSRYSIAMDLSHVLITSSQRSSSLNA